MHTHTRKNALTPKIIRNQLSNVWTIKMIKSFNRPLLKVLQFLFLETCKDGIDSTFFNIMPC